MNTRMNIIPIFRYCYRAKRNEEVEAIRNHYLLQLNDSPGRKKMSLSPNMILQTVVGLFGCTLLCGGAYILVNRLLSY